MPVSEWSYTAVFSAHSAVVGRAVKGLPGLCFDSQLEFFSTWTQAENRARLLNDELGLKPVEARAITIGVALCAKGLIAECSSLMNASRRLKAENQEMFVGVMLAELELGVTFCRMACDPRLDLVKCRLIQKARKALSDTRRAMEGYALIGEAAREVLAETRRLEDSLEGLRLQ